MGQPLCTWASIGRLFQGVNRRSPRRVCRNGTSVSFVYYFRTNLFHEHRGMHYFLEISLLGYSLCSEGAKSRNKHALLENLQFLVGERPHSSIVRVIQLVPEIRALIPDLAARLPLE